MKMEFILKNLDLSQYALVLDVGCGTGLLFEYLRGKVKLIVGVDISKNILLEAKRKLQGGCEVVLVQADADYLPFPDGIFDVVFAVTLLQNMPSPTATLREMFRVANSQAIILVTGLKKSFKLEEFRRLLESFSLKKIFDAKGLKDYIAFLHVKT